MLLEKKDLLKIVKNDRDLNLIEFKKMRVKELREHLRITHEIDGQYKDMTGNCFKCLEPLKPDYTGFKNYCMDCSL